MLYVFTPLYTVKEKYSIALCTMFSSSTVQLGLSRRRPNLCVYYNLLKIAQHY